MKTADNTSGRQFSLFVLSGLGLMVSAIVLAVRLIPNVSTFAGVVLARFVHSCSQLIAGLSGRDIVISSMDLILLSVIGLFFLVAAVLCIIVIVRTSNYVRMLRSKAGVTISEKIERAKRHVRFPVVEVDDPRSYVMSTGFFRPTIYISWGMVEMLNDQELVGVLLHEEHHCIKRDTFRLFIVQFFTKTLWFVPGIGKFSTYVRTLFEISADDAAITKQGTDGFLGSALVKALKIRETSVPATLPAFSAINDRIDRILNRQFSPRTRFAAVVPFVTLLLFAGSLVFSHSTFAAPRTPTDGTAIHLMSQSTVCPRIVPQLLMSVPQNTACITNAVQHGTTCEEVQSKAK